MIDQLPETKQTEREAALPETCCSLSLCGPSEGENRRYSWGASTVIEGNHVKRDFDGVSYVYYHPFASGLGPTNSTCFGCPHLGIDNYGQTHCAAPLMVECYGCPQFLGGGASLRSKSDCPMAMTDREKRIYRLRVKFREIFWDYYVDRGKNPRAEGFRVS